MPESLRENAEQWTADLMDAVEQYKIQGTPVPKYLQNRYKNDDVLASLKKMYGDSYGRSYCCYCETQIGVVDYPHIEHRKPKSPDRFPECTYDWHNLHLACEKCNGKKRDQWDIENEILDAVKDIPMSDHLGYCTGGIDGIYRETLSNRGITTVNHADLDREELLRARLEVYQATREAIEKINDLGDDPRAYTARKMLRAKCSGAFGSMVEYLMNRCLR